jgi:hypothetical protein
VGDARKFDFSLHTNFDGKRWKIFNIFRISQPYVTFSSINAFLFKFSFKSSEKNIVENTKIGKIGERVKL